MRSTLNGGVEFLLFRSGHLGGRQIRRDLVLLVEMVLLPKGSAPRGARLEVSLIREAFPDQKGVVASKTAPVAKDLFDMSLDEIISDIEWEPTIMELLTPEVSLVVGDPEKEPEKEDPVEPEPVPDVELEKEKMSAASGSRSKRSTASRLSRRKPTKRSKPRTQDMILEGLYWSDESQPESAEDGCLLLGLTRDIIDLD